eukprot:c7796_g1_i1 orf=70-1023(+)
MAMAKVCRNLTSTQLLQRAPSSVRGRPAAISAFLSRDKQSPSASGAISQLCSAAARVFTPRIISIFSYRGFMANAGQVSALSDHAAGKDSWDPEDSRGGGGDDGGNGSGRGGNGGNGGDDFSGGSKGDDTPPNSLFSWYLMLLNKYPVRTKAVTSALLTLFGDLVCQLMIEKNEMIDLRRIGVFTLLGLVLVGPTLHFWYLNLSKLIPGPGTLKAAARLVLDQFLFSPIFIGVFLSSMLTLEGHSYDVVPKLQQDWLSVVVANWKIWIPFQFLNFLLVPQQFQVLAANVIALAWNTYLSFAAHKDVMTPAQKDSFSS